MRRGRPRGNPVNRHLFLVGGVWWFRWARHGRDVRRSTECPRSEVAAARKLPVDYFGFGPIYASSTKVSERALLGPELAWLAARASSVPIFPIGGIERANARALAPVGRAAVSAAILRAEEPGRAAAELRAMLQR